MGKKRIKLGGEYYKKVKKIERDPNDIWGKMADQAFGFERIDAPSRAAREQFLLGIERIAPEVLQSLYEDVFPLFCEVRNSDWGFGLDCFNIDKTIERHHSGELSVFGHRFIEWLEHWHLTESWLWQAAVSTLEQWEPDKEPYLYLRTPSDQLEWYFQRYYQIGKKAFEFKPLGVFAWNPEQETLESFSKRLTAYFEKQRDKYLNEIKATIEAEGAIPTPEKSGLDHFEWLVRWHVQGWTKQQMMEHYHKGWTTLQEAMGGVRKLIGLRPKPAGRPRKNKGNYIPM